MIRTLGVKPKKTSYGVQASEEQKRVVLAGGKGFYRRGYTNSFLTVNCTFQVSREGYRYMRAFYRTATQHGSLPFYLQAVFPYSTVSSLKAYFVPGSLSLQAHTGHRYTVTAQIIVEQTVRRAA